MKDLDKPLGASGGHKKSPGAIFDVALATAHRVTAMDGGHKKAH
ncbi:MULTISPECIES: hypothetical protein [Alcanivorax]|nr:MULTISPECIES: hypothetical protein [Alcanivorax]